MLRRAGHVAKHVSKLFMEMMYDRQGLNEQSTNSEEFGYQVQSSPAACRILQGVVSLDRLNIFKLCCI